MTWLLIIWLRGYHQIGSATVGPEYSNEESCNKAAKVLINAGLNAVCLQKEK